MNTIITLLILLSTLTPMSQHTQTTLRETVKFIQNTTYTGVSAESNVLSTRLTLEILIRNGTAVKIDYIRYYQAIKQVEEIRLIRGIIAKRYNLIVKRLEHRNIEIPSGIPRRMRLTPTDWTVTFQY